MTREVVDKSPTVLKQKEVPLILLVWVHGIITPKKKRNFLTSISEPSEFHLSSRMLSLFLGARSGRHKGWIRILDEVLYLLKCFCCVPPPEKNPDVGIFCEKIIKKITSNGPVFWCKTKGLV